VTEYIYRTGRHWGVTIVRERLEPGNGLVAIEGTSQLIATAQTPGGADLIVAALNAYEKAVTA
jgi:hypothetical protein